MSLSLADLFEMLQIETMGTPQSDGGNDFANSQRGAPRPENEFSGGNIALPVARLQNQLGIERIQRWQRITGR